MPNAEPAATVCHRLGGVARSAALRTAGVSKKALAAAVAAGELVQPRRGVYAIPAVSDAVAEALAHRGAIGCVTAARHFGLWTLDAGAAEPAHVWVHPDRQAAWSADCTCVRHRDTPVDTVSLWVVGLVHCLVQIVMCKGPEAFVAALESALRQKLIGTVALARLREVVPRRFAWLVDFARADADSGLESVLRYRLHLLGISLASQVLIPGVGRVDFVIGDCLILEADGGTHDGSARHADRVRDAVAMSLGFVTLRFDSAMILHEWELVEAAILAALGRNLHRSAAGIRREADRILAD